MMDGIIIVLLLIILIVLLRINSRFPARDYIQEAIDRDKKAKQQSNQDD